MYKRGAKGWAKHLDFIMLDLICVEISLAVAYMIRHGFQNPFQNPAYAGMFVVMMLMDFLLLLFLDTFKNVLKRGCYRELVSTMKQSIALFLCTTAYMFAVQAGYRYSRITIALTVVLYFIFSYGVHILWKKYLRRRMHEGKGDVLLIMADRKSVPLLIREIKRNNYASHQISGVVVKEEDETGRMIDGVPVVAAYQDIIQYAASHWVDEILVSVNPNEHLLSEVLDTLIAMGITVHIHAAVFSKHEEVKQTISNVGGLLVISNSTNQMTLKQYFLKRGMDIIGGFIGCVATGILYLFIAPAIKRESPGKVFFSQTRIGRNGKPFKMYKFRSMYPDAEKRKAELMEQNRMKDGLMFKMDFDPRIIGNKIDENGNQVTGIGHRIRTLSIDEFPQFFNVLKGDMSLVGTRPPLESEYAQYLPYHKARLAAKPGITGLWQISGRSSILDFEDVVKLDTQYINDWSIGLDIKILIKTVKVVLKKEGSM